MNVAILWHMHQPHYVDSLTAVALMPWVRLHATKGYLDMIWLVEQYPEFHCIFNLTPVLLRQIQQLANREITDRWHQLAVTPAAELTPQQRCALLEHYFKANWDNMIKPHARYWSLLQKRGQQLDRANLPRVAASFNEQEIRDLQVWFHLTWFGYAAEKLYPDISALKQKGRDFTEEDKETLFRCQQNILQTLIQRYKSAADRGQIEISTSPFYHPILPLLFNTHFARRAMPGCRLPPAFEHPEDAHAQLKLAQEQHQKLFGSPARGLWPSEGSVCPELIPLLNELGFEWFATDEEILWRTLPNGTTPGREFLYQGFQVEQGSCASKIVFRDRSLSDFIGFTASRNPPRQSADLLMAQIDGILHNQVKHNQEALCTIILDGENAWEHFPDGGETFLRSLYERLLRHGALQTVTIHQHFQQHPPRTTLRNLYTGSWINADFHIWIGDREDNRAWQLLAETRSFLKNQKNIPPALEQQVMDQIYAAEGSDWFWWYGDQFVSDNDLLFDELFRGHLQNVYQLLGIPVPLSLKTRICRSEFRHTIHPPSDFLTPTIDGHITSFYEWSAAGMYEANQDSATMFRSQTIIKAISFGFDTSNFFLRVDFEPPTIWPGDLLLRVHFVGDDRKHLLEVTVLRTKQCRASIWAIHDNTKEGRQALENLAFNEVMEIQIPLQTLKAENSRHLSFFLEVAANGIDWERHPDQGSINIEFPENGPASSWQV